MNADGRRRRVEEVCDGALERAAGERPAFLAMACAGDSDLRREVEALLKHAGTAEGFLDAPPGAVAAAMMTSGEALSLLGTRIGPYDVRSKLGEGGMGEVYRARDTQLGRDVAIKVLPRRWSEHGDRLARFNREARVLASLNHPHIAAIYGIEQSAAGPVLILELVEGATLAAHAGGRPLPLSQALAIARQIAEALEAAHEKGIVHRDLKPLNVMVTAAGTVKILDFGLAKAVATDGRGDVSDSPTITQGGTAQGALLGTAAYMSPEQARGQAVDRQTDIWAFGCVVYEMLTGRAPHARATLPDTLTAVLEREPDWAALPVATPPSVRRLLRRCLEKDPKRRLHDIADARIEIDEPLDRDTERGSPAAGLAEVKQDLDSGGLAASGVAIPRRAGSVRSLLRVVVGGGIVLGAVWAVAYRWLPRQAAADPPPVGGERAFTQLTTQPGLEEYPSVSPDGKWVVYDGNQAGNADIYLQSVGGHNAINLTKDSPEDDTQPAFSPDGEQIAFRTERAGGGIFVMGRTGESVRRVTDTGFNPAWSPDGTKIVYATDAAHVGGRMYVSELWTVVVATGETRRIFEGDAVQPSWSPHGLRIAFWTAYGERVGQRDVRTISAEGEAAVAVTSDPAVDWNPVWSADGRYLYFSSDRGGPMNLWRVPIDESSGKVLGSPEPLSAPSSSAALMSLSADGSVLAYTSFANSATIQSVALDPSTGTVRGEPVTVVAGSRPFTTPAISPDGRWLAFVSTVPQLDVFISRADGSGIRQLTNDRANDKFPNWSPDGQQIAFMSNRDGKNQIWSIKADGSGLRRLTAVTSGAGFYSEWSRDGSKLIFHGMEPPDDSTMFVFDPRVEWTHQTPRIFSRLVQAGVQFAEASWSPDGQQLSGTAQPADRDRGALVIYSFKTGRFTQLYDSQSAGTSVWLNDGRRLLFDEGSKLRLIDSQTRSVRDVLSIAPDTLDLWSLSRDNRAAYFVRRVSQADVWLMTLK